MRDEIERYENLLRGQRDERVRKILHDLIAEAKAARAHKPSQLRDRPPTRVSANRGAATEDVATMTR